jgi:hypothetical protein
MLHNVAPVAWRSAAELRDAIAVFREMNAL